MRRRTQRICDLTGADTYEKGKEEEKRNSFLHLHSLILQQLHPSPSLTMPQMYYYTAPCVKWLSIIASLLAILFLILLIAEGLFHPVTYIIVIITVVVYCVIVLLYPGTCYKTSRVLEDGREVRVRRPLIGFKSQERLVGLTGGHEVRIDRWRYEEALIRI